MFGFMSKNRRMSRKLERLTAKNDRMAERIQLAEGIAKVRVSLASNQVKVKTAGQPVQPKRKATV